MSNEQQFLAASATLVKKIKELALEFGVADRLILVSLIGIVDQNEEGNDVIETAYDIFVHEDHHLEEALNFLEEAYVHDATPERGTVEWWLRKME